jgi:hypothetical protein
MKHRKLRIAFSAVCGMLCLLLIFLWVRSYSVPLTLLRANTARTEAFGVQSSGGRFVVGEFKLPGRAPPIDGCAAIDPPAIVTSRAAGLPVVGLGYSPRSPQ